MAGMRDSVPVSSQPLPSRIGLAFVWCIVVLSIAVHCKAVYAHGSRHTSFSEKALEVGRDLP